MNTEKIFGLVKQWEKRAKNIEKANGVGWSFEDPHSAFEDGARETLLLCAQQVRSLVEEKIPCRPEHAAQKLFSDHIASTEPSLLMTIKDVEQKITVKKSKIYNMIAAGMFPGPIKIGKRTTRWRSSDVVRWLENVGR